MSSTSAVQLAGLASIALDPRRVKIDPRKLTFHRSRIEPTDPAELAARNERRLALADSWLENPINDIIVRDGDYAVGDGNERVAGILLRGVAEITVSLLPAGTTDEQLDQIGMLTDFFKTALTTMERANLARKIKESAGISNKELAERLRIDAGYLTKLLSIFDTKPSVQDAARAGLIGPSDWYPISKAGDQEETLRLALGGATSREVSDSVKKRKFAPAVRASKIKCPLSSGVVVQVNGLVSLEEAIESLAEAQKAMKAAIAKGYSAKTFQAMLADTNQ